MENNNLSENSKAKTKPDNDTTIEKSNTTTVDKSNANNENSINEENNTVKSENNQNSTDENTLNAQEQEKDTNIYTKKFKIIKGRFKTNKIIAYGGFLIIINSEVENLNRLNVQVSLKQHFFDEFNIKDNWYAVEGKLIASSLRLKEINQGITNGLRQVLIIFFETRSFLTPVIKHFEKNDINKIEEILKDKILDVISDQSLHIETEYTSLDELEIPEELETKKEVTVDIDPRTYVDIDIVKDPVNGVQIKDLQPGQRVFIQNFPQELIDEHSLDQTSSFRNDRLFPSFVEIIKNDSTDETGEWTAVFNFGGGIYGRVDIYPIVKVKIFQENTLIVEEALSSPAMDESERREVLKMYLIFLGILIIFGIIVVWYYKYGIMLLLK